MEIMTAPSTRSKTGDFYGVLNNSLNEIQLLF